MLSTTDSCIQLAEGVNSCICKPGYGGKYCQELASQVAPPESFFPPGFLVASVGCDQCGFGGEPVCIPPACPPGRSCEPTCQLLDGSTFNLGCTNYSCACFPFFEPLPIERSCALSKSLPSGRGCVMGTLVSGFDLGKPEFHSTAKYCLCLPGWVGIACDIPQSLQITLEPEGHTSVCENGGTKPGPNLPCSCPPGFFGTSCSLDYRGCNGREQVCQNGGSCQPFWDGTFRCQCAPGFRGLFCDELDTCPSSGCDCGVGTAWYGADCRSSHDSDKLVLWISAISFSNGTVPVAREDLCAWSLFWECDDRGFVRAVDVDCAALHLGLVNMTLFPGDLDRLERLSLLGPCVAGRLPPNLATTNLTMVTTRLEGPITWQGIHGRKELFAFSGDRLILDRSPEEALWLPLAHSRGQLSIAVFGAPSVVLPALSNILQLRVLSLFGPGVTGPFPDIFPSFTRPIEWGYVEWLISNTQLSGTFPQSVHNWNLKRGRIAIVNNPKLTGPLPPFAPGRFELRLENNNFVGTIPDSYLSLLSLRLGGNDLDCPVKDYSGIAYSNDYAAVSQACALCPPRSPYQCSGHGICTTRSAPGCRCNAGFNGTNCEFDYSQCMSNPCPPDYTCTPFEGGFYCLGPAPTFTAAPFAPSTDTVIILGSVLPIFLLSFIAFVFVAFRRKWMR